MGVLIMLMLPEWRYMYLEFTGVLTLGQNSEM